MLKITIPPPPPALWPNGRPSRFGKAKAVKKYRYACGLAALDAVNRAGPEWRKPHDRLTIQPIFYRQNLRSRPDGDNANAALKAAYDSLADAGLIRNDRDLSVCAPRFEIDRDVRVVLELSTGEDQ